MHPAQRPPSCCVCSTNSSLPALHGGEPRLCAESYVKEILTTVDNMSLCDRTKRSASVKRQKFTGMYADGVKTESKSCSKEEAAGLLRRQ